MIYINYLLMLLKYENKKQLIYKSKKIGKNHFNILNSDFKVKSLLIEGSRGEDGINFLDSNVVIVIVRGRVVFAYFL